MLFESLYSAGQGMSHLVVAFVFLFCFVFLLYFEGASFLGFFMRGAYTLSIFCFTHLHIKFHDSEGTVTE